MWTPGSELLIQVLEEQKRLYDTDDPRCLYHDYCWPYRVGRHESGEFPVVVVRKHFMDHGFRVFVSGQSKMGIDSYVLVMFPRARERRDRSYLNIVEAFGEDKVKAFIAIVEGEKQKAGFPRHGGDPDLFVLNLKKPRDRFFVEVKLEDLTGRRRYADKLNDQQRLVFPLIEKHLKCRVRLARVQISARLRAEG